MKFEKEHGGYESVHILRNRYYCDCDYYYFIEP
jgi:hypothetical protein